jgi:hypothetical protein
VILGIDAQIAVMAKAWPRLAVTARDRGRALWRGPVTPLLQTYEIEIAYRAPLVIELLNVRRLQPRVRVLSPALRPRPGDPEGRLPHVYYAGDGPDDVILCLLDPDGREWSPVDALAETTVPWTIDWLAAYEAWRATGRWKATGRHVETAELLARAT